MVRRGTVVKRTSLSKSEKSELLSSYSVRQCHDKLKVLDRDVHNQILVGIQDLLDKQRIHMKREEASVLRNFKDRMKVLQEDLRAERSSDAKSGDSKWLDKAVSSLFLLFSTVHNSNFFLNLLLLCITSL